MRVLRESELAGLGQSLSGPSVNMLRPYNGSRGAWDKGGHGVPCPYEFGGDEEYG
jgi:hypothetical protein